MTSTSQDEFAVLRMALEERFELHTGQLIELTRSILDGGETGGGLDRESAAAMTVASRQALADVTDALRRMAEGSYGTCEGCQGEIPRGRLAALPHARFCMRCQRGSDPGERER
jgi:DnaK suppressor protein